MATARQTRNSDNSWRGAEKNDTTTWKCIVCTFVNTKNISVCEMCNNKKGETTDVNQPKEQDNKIQQSRGEVTHSAVNPNNSPAKCFLCGEGCRISLCIHCNNKHFCDECREQYHKHPYRKWHDSQLVEKTIVNAVTASTSKEVDNIVGQLKERMQNLQMESSTLMTEARQTMKENIATFKLQLEKQFNDSVTLIQQKSETIKDFKVQITRLTTRKTDDEELKIKKRIREANDEKLRKIKMEKLRTEFDKNRKREWLTIGQQLKEETRKEMLKKYLKQRSKINHQKSDSTYNHAIIEITANEMADKFKIKSKAMKNIWDKRVEVEWQAEESNDRIKCDKLSMKKCKKEKQKLIDNLKNLDTSCDCQSEYCSICTGSDAQQSVWKNKIDTFSEFERAFSKFEVKQSINFQNQIAQLENQFIYHFKIIQQREEDYAHEVKMIKQALHETKIELSQTKIICSQLEDDQDQLNNQLLNLKGQLCKLNEKEKQWNLHRSNWVKKESDLIRSLEDRMAKHESEKSEFTDIIAALNERECIQAKKLDKAQHNVDDAYVRIEKMQAEISDWTMKSEEWDKERSTLLQNALIMNEIITHYQNNSDSAAIFNEKSQLANPWSSENNHKSEKTPPPNPLNDDLLDLNDYPMLPSKTNDALKNEQYKNDSEVNYNSPSTYTPDLHRAKDLLQPTSPQKMNCEKTNTKMSKEVLNTNSFYDSNETHPQKPLEWAITSKMNPFNSVVSTTPNSYSDAVHSHQVSEFGEQSTYGNSTVNIVILGCGKRDSVLIYLNALFNFVVLDDMEEAFTNDPICVIKYELNTHQYPPLQFVEQNADESCQEYHLNSPFLNTKIRFIISHGNLLSDTNKLFDYVADKQYQLHSIFVVFKNNYSHTLLEQLSLLHHDVNEIVTVICHESYGHTELPQLLQKRDRLPQALMTFNSITFTDWVWAHHRQRDLERFRSHWQIDSIKWRTFFQTLIIRQNHLKSAYETQAIIKATVFEEKMISKMLNLVMRLVQLEDFHRNWQSPLNTKRNEIHEEKVVQHAVKLQRSIKTLLQKIEYLLSVVLRIEFHIKNNCIAPIDSTFGQLLESTINANHQLSNRFLIKLRANELCKKWKNTEGIKIRFNSAEEVINTIKECEQIDDDCSFV